LARERLIQFQRRHMHAQQRSVAREEAQELSLADGCASVLSLQSNSDPVQFGLFLICVQSSPCEYSAAIRRYSFTRPANGPYHSDLPTRSPRRIWKKTLSDFARSCRTNYKGVLVDSVCASAAAAEYAIARLDLGRRMDPIRVI
jgi:hypothetical protein